MLLWNQVALWRHAAGARTITGYPFGPTNLPVNSFGPWPGGTSWTPPAETACVLPWLGRHSLIPSRGRGVGPPLHEATHHLRQQQRTGVIARAAHLIGPCSAPSLDATMAKTLRSDHAPPISTRQAHGRTRVAASVRVSAAPVSSMRPRASSGSYTSRRPSFLVRMRHGTGVRGPMRGRRRAPRSSRRALEQRRAAPQSTPLDRAAPSIRAAAQGRYFSAVATAKGGWYTVWSMQLREE